MREKNATSQTRVSATGCVSSIHFPLRASDNHIYPGDILADARLMQGAYNGHLTPLDPSARELVARYGNYAAVYGFGGDDLLYGRADGTPTHLDGGAGSDVIFAQEGGYTTSVLIPDQPGAVVDGGQRARRHPGRLGERLDHGRHRPRPGLRPGGR